MWALFIGGLYSQLWSEFLKSGRSFFTVGLNSKMVSIHGWSVFTGSLYTKLECTVTLCEP